MARSMRACGLAAFLTVFVLGLAPADEKSALEREPDGWTDLLASAGPELKGWSRGSIPPGNPVPAASQWSFDPGSGVLLCKGDGGHEWLRWDKEQADFVFHVEWRFTPVEGKKGYNSGVFVRNSATGKLWLQAQTGSGSGGFLFGDTLVNGQVTRMNLSKQMTEQRVKPAGEWNTYEITCSGPEIRLWVNGATTCGWKSAEVPSGYVGLEAEGWRIEFRNVKLKRL